MAKPPKLPLTTNQGAPVADNTNSQTAGNRGPVLLQDHQLIEKLAHFDRERIPERVVHAKGAGAFGFFECTKDMSRLTRAHLFGKKGRRTPVLVRFSTVGGERGSADSERDPRGFAVKLYTEQGNYDIVGNNLPVFFIRDAMKFPDMVHTHKRDPATGLKDPDAFWDFFAHTPESTHMVTMLFSDRGTPFSFRHMQGFGVHTFLWVDERDQGVYVKYHFRSKAGVKTLSAAEAQALAGSDPDHATRDLHRHLAGGGKAEWEVSVQVMPIQDADTYRYDPFDVTMVWRHSDYPRIPIGRLVLDRNPTDVFTEVEQAAFAPANMVPGIEPSPDRLLQGRLFSRCCPSIGRCTASPTTSATVLRAATTTVAVVPTTSPTAAVVRGLRRSVAHCRCRWRRRRGSSASGSRRARTTSSRRACCSG